MIKGVPTYKALVSEELNPEGYFLADGSAGKGKAMPLNNFNDNGGDVGAYNGSLLEYGSLAYL